jgi:tetratricopeptide (TPR) repeat protein
MELLAQAAGEAALDSGDGVGLWMGLALRVAWGAFSFLSLLYVVFWAWMLFQCLRSEPDRFFWIWLLVIAPFPGAIVYAALRYFPAADDRPPVFLRQWARGKELARLETAAEQIGNAHQFIQWGDALREVGRWDDAEDAYGRALEKDPENLQALWGAAQVAERNRDFQRVEELTRRILDRDPQYKFGDVSLSYGKALDEQRETQAARAHFEQHVKRWRHPEGVFRLARLCRELGDTDAARQHLRALLQDLNASPSAIARKFGRWKSRAKQMLRALPQPTHDT